MYVSRHRQLMPAVVIALALGTVCLADTPAERVGILWDRAIRQVDAGKLDDALASAGKAVQIAPGDSEAFRLMGWVFEQRHECLGAEACYRKALELAPGRALLHVARGRMLDQPGGSKEAVVEYRKALNLNPDDAEACQSLAAELAAQGQVDQAVAAARAAVRLAPEAATSRAALGDSLRQVGNADEAVAELRKALQLDQARIAEDHNDLGLALLEDGSVEEAIAELKEAVRLAGDPDTEAWFRNNLACAYTLAAQWPEALDECGRARQVEPDQPWIEDTYGEALLLSGDSKRAEVVFRAALRLEPAGPETSAGLALCLAQEGQRPEAARLLTGIGADLGKPYAPIEVLYFAGKAYVALGEPARARELFARAVQHWPKHPWAADMRTYLRGS